MNSFAIAFASENYAGVHPEMMKALEAANNDYEKSYGNDNYTASALDQFRLHFGDQAEVYYAFNGTGANVFALSVMLKRFEALICSDVAHVYDAESTAFEALTGCRIFPVPSDHGKITPETVLTRMARVGDVQHPQVKAITITQPTEYGTIYGPEELKRLSMFADEHNLLLHIDGARLFNAAAALGCSLREITQGADIVTVGGTKSGLMYGEAVVILRPEKFSDANFLLKRSMQLSSKTRFIACQFDSILRNDLWKNIGEHANNMATYLHERLRALPGVKITRPLQTNALFAILPNNNISAIQEEIPFYFWNKATREVRLICSFNTTKQHVDALIDLLDVSDKH